MSVTVPNLWRLIKPFPRYADFSVSKWRTFAILDLLYASLEHSRRVFGGLYRHAQFGWNGTVVSIIGKFSYFANLAWKCPFRPILRLGILPQNEKTHQRNHKRHTVARKDVIWRTARQNRFTCATCARDRPKRKDKVWRETLLSQTALRTRPDHPGHRIEIKFCMAVVFGRSLKFQISSK